MTKEELQFYTVHELQVIGRNLCVPHPSMLKKSVLIDEIIKAQNSENATIRKNKGKRAHAGTSNLYNTQTIDAWTTLKIESILDKAKSDILELLTH